jgi:serine/threonine-protein kinase HipA
VFNVLVGNADAHVKNWSVIYPDGRTAALAPAYDLVSTIAYIPNDSLALSLGGTKTFADVDADRFRHLAEQAGLPVRIVLRTVHETTERVRGLWAHHEPAGALPDRIRQAVTNHMQAMRL